MFECLPRCLMCVPGAYGGQKRKLDPLGLKLQTVVCLNVGTRNETQVL